MDNLYTRREFLQKGAQWTASAAVLDSVASDPPRASRLLPTRKLGRTGAEVSIIGLGLAPLGLAGYSRQEFRSTIEAALDEGVNYFDVQPDYGDVERYLAPIARDHRDRLFITTKTFEKSKRSVLDSVRGSLDRLDVDQLDAVLVNNIGLYEMKQIFGADGVLAGLKAARQQGQVRFFGLSGHCRPEHFTQAMETEEFDIVMAPFNFVDRFTYRFEQEILPVAAKHHVGVVAMKTYGGAVGLSYQAREQRALLPDDKHQLAIRYVLGLPGISLALIGCKSSAEIHTAAHFGREYCPLSDVELASAEAEGARLAAQWGRHYPEG
ncbi:MAG TPA: aldo/keto reductase [Terriglobales bacterium]|nr:aldo/keto reductase [Terriglobales bacterium]